VLWIFGIIDKDDVLEPSHLIVQKGLTYEMVEKAWKLPRGFLVAYAPNEDKGKEGAKGGGGRCDQEGSE
jgi:hypothetical protein